MLRITVEIVPYGIESQKKTVLALTIFNDATGTKEYGNYQYIATENVDNMEGENFCHNHDQKKYGGEVKHFKRSRMAKELIDIVLKQMIQEERWKCIPSVSTGDRFKNCDATEADIY